MALTSKGHFKIGTNEFAAKSIKVGIDSIAAPNSGRTDDGVQHIYWVLRRCRKVEIEMPPTKDRAMIANLLNLVQGREYSITYFDPIDNAERTLQVYTSKSESDMYSGVIYNGVLQGVKFNAIELAGEA